MPGVKLLALGKTGQRSELEVEDVWDHKGRLVLKFHGVDSISDAESLKGCELQVPAAERIKLGAGSAYVSDLTGCRVTDQGREVGVVADVIFGAGEAPLLVIREGTKEYLVPLAQEFLEALDVEHKQVHMKLPAGMLDINRPLTDDEKARQAGKN